MSVNAAAAVLTASATGQCESYVRAPGERYTAALRPEMFYLRGYRLPSLSLLLSRLQGLKTAGRSIMGNQDDGRETQLSSYQIGILPFFSVG